MNVPSTNRNIALGLRVEGSNAIVSKASMNILAMTEGTEEPNGVEDI